MLTLSAWFFSIYSGNTNCITETLTNIQNLVGNLSLTNIEGLVASGFPSNVSTNDTSSVLCTDCVKAAYNVINTDFPSLISSEQSTLQSQCGSSFTGKQIAIRCSFSETSDFSTDGSAPSGIVETASNSSSSTSTGSNSAFGVYSGNVLFGTSASILLALGSAFAML